MLPAEHFFPTVSGPDGETETLPEVPAVVAPQICVGAAASHSGDTGTSSPRATDFSACHSMKDLEPLSDPEDLSQPLAAKASPAWNHPGAGPGALGAARAGGGRSPFVVGSFIHRVVMAQKTLVRIWPGAAAELHVPLSTDGTG